MKSEVERSGYYIGRMQWVRLDGYLVSDDQERLDLVRIHHWLSDESPRL
jgi:hypothetical protein